MQALWLIGSGPMALDYIKVLRGLERDFVVIGRGAASAAACEQATGCTVQAGGLSAWLALAPPPASHAIVSVGVEALLEATLQLIDYGVRHILVEKPAGLQADQVARLAAAAAASGATVYVAYNRRFFASVLEAQRMAAEDGGVTSFNFEFTEWSHVIGGLQKAPGVLEHWFLANSTHVVDLAFHLGGAPRELSAYRAGALPWHPSGAVFAGAGVSEHGALFSYQANWESAGRWGVEILTRARRLVLRPMEKLQVQKRGSIALESVECRAELDEQYKPGLFLQTRAFLDDAPAGLCNIAQQAALMNTYCRMAGYAL